MAEAPFGCAWRSSPGPEACIPGDRISRRLRHQGSTFHKMHGLVVENDVLEGPLAVLAHVALHLDVRAAVGVAVALATRAAIAGQRRAVVVEVAHLQKGKRVG